MRFVERRSWPSAAREQDLPSDLVAAVEQPERRDALQGRMEPQQHEFGRTAETAAPVGGVHHAYHAPELFDEFGRVGHRSRGQRPCRGESLFEIAGWRLRSLEEAAAP